MGIKHTKVSVTADEGTPGDRVQPSHWNANHDLSALVAADLPADLRPTTNGPLNSTMLTTFQPQGQATTTVAFGANETYLTPTIIPFDATIEAAIEITTAGAAGAKATVALYKDVAGVLTLVKAFGEFSTDSTGLKYSGDTYFAKAGLYYVFVSNKTAATTWRYAAPSAPASAIGLYSAASGLAASSRIQITGLTYTYPPATTPSFTYTRTNGGLLLQAFFRIS